MRLLTTTKRRRSTTDGFTLIEALISTALMAAILGALAVVTAQWLPNWNHGFAFVQQTELTAIGLERVVADVSAAKFLPPLGASKKPIFDGRTLSITFVRSALDPNARPGLEFVHIGETSDARGLALVRTRAPYIPLPIDAIDQIKFSDQVVLIRAPYRVSFAYAGRDRVWRDSWQDAAELPAAVRITLRDATTAQVLAASTVATIHVTAPAECVSAGDAKNCGTAKAAAGGQEAAPGGQQNEAGR
jgi:general secretion pathway protein J